MFRGKKAGSTWAQTPVPLGWDRNWLVPLMLSCCMLLKDRASLDSKRPSPAWSDAHTLVTGTECAKRCAPQGSGPGSSHFGPRTPLTPTTHMYRVTQMPGVRVCSLQSQQVDDL